MPPRYDPAVIQAIVRASRQSGIDPTLMTAVALEESGLNPRSQGDYQGGAPTSFGLAQLHRGGALGNLTPQQAMDPYTNIGVVARAFAKAGGRGQAAGPQSLTNYYRQIGRGSSVSGPTSKALAYLPQARQLVSQYGGASVPPVGGQQQQSAAGTPAAGGLPPALMAALLKYGERSTAAGLAGNRDFALPTGLLAQLGKIQQQTQVPAVGGPRAPTGSQTPSAALDPSGLAFPVPRGGTFSVERTDRGQDFSTNPGANVLAVAPGTVTYSAGGGGFGDHYTVIKLDKPIKGYSYMFYGHGSSALVRPGQRVNAGQPVVTSGGHGGGGPGHIELGFALGPTGQIEAPGPNHYAASGQAMHDLLTQLNPGAYAAGRVG